MASIQISALANLLSGLLCLLGKEHGLNVWQDTSLSNGHSGEKLVQLLVVTDGQLKMTGNDSALLVVTGSVSCQLKNLGGQVLHHSGKVHWGTSSHPLCVIALSQVAVDTAHGELETSSAAASLGLALCFSSFASSRHVDIVIMCSVYTLTETWTRSIKSWAEIAFELG